MLDFITKETAPNPNATVIWMHGLGADGYDFADIVPELQLSPSAKIRFIFPHAPIIPVSINNNYKMRAWYNITDMNLAKNPDIKGIKENAKFIEELIDREIETGIKSDRIILIGFSQGGVMALHTATRCKKKLAGAVCLSSYFPTAESLDEEGSEANKNIPIFFGHGNFDAVVPPELGLLAYNFFKSRGNPIERHTYNMQHSVCLEELTALGAWVNGIFT
ncbi:phospholipase/carboxylesterase [Fibrobacterales bacterium]|nr:phospholipase/carboxylesterase [Fibrobacterales bacterium]